MNKLQQWAGLSVLAANALAADLPIQRVVLYKNGVALFERAGAVAAGEDARIELRTADMNDILKSLLIVDGSGHRVQSIRYDSNQTMDDRLKSFPFSLRAGQYMADFLDGFRGAAIELKTADRSLSGSVLSARAIKSTDERRELLREQITLLLSSGEIQTLDLGAVSSFRFPDPKLQSQLKQYLQTMNESRNQEKRSVLIDSAGAGQRNLTVSYVVPAPIWKSSYRLTLEEPKATLEGWAIVDNTSDEDWDHVRLSAVSGRPVSFISQLDIPRYGHREVVELPEDAAANPTVYGGTVGSGSAGGVIGGVLGGIPGAPPPPPPAQKALSSYNTVEVQASARAIKPAQSTVQSAESTAIGELFEYNFPEPITIRRNQSGMLPFLQDRVSARKLLIFNDKGSEHPVNAAELVNTTAKTLDGGPITVYEGGAYAGEALVETFKAGDKRLIGYAVDYGTRITTAFDSDDQTIREIHAGDGVLKLRYANHQTRTYTINNVDAKPKTLVLQQEGIGEYEVLSPKPSERTATAYRFEVKLTPNQSRTFKVEQERVYDETTEVTSSTPDYLLTLVENKRLTQAGRKQLENVASLKRQAAEVQTNLQSAGNQVTELTADQTRLRQNIDSLNRVNGQEAQVRQYSAQLGSNEVELAKVRDTQRTLNARRSALETQIRDAISQLSF